MEVTLHAVGKSLGGQPVLTDLTLRVAEGEALSILGPSGCGKSTVLRLIAGLLFADAGEVRVGDRLMSRASAPRLQRQMGYVIQEGGLFPHLTVRDNLLLADRRAPLPAEQRERRLREILEMTRLSPALLARHPSELSGGQRQRVGVARALYPRPQLLLLDEPFGALDPLVRAELQTELGALIRASSTTTILVTHDVAEAAILASRVLLLKSGAIEQEGSLRELVAAPRSPFVRAFLRAGAPTLFDTR